MLTKLDYVEIKCQLDATDDFYCRSYCLLNMFRAHHQELESITGVVLLRGLHRLKFQKFYPTRPDPEMYRMIC